VQGGPAVQFGRAVAVPLGRVLRQVGGGPAGVAAGQVEQFAAEVQGGQAEEILDRWRHLLAEGPRQADQRVLHNVLDLFPGSHSGEAAEHPAGELLQPLLGAADQGVQGAGLARLEACDQVAQGGRREFVHRRRP
jgi:hypothetical protein